MAHGGWVTPPWVEPPEDEAPQACSVSHALLKENDLTDACEPALFEFVAAQRLRVLDLEGNALGLRGLEAVCRALADASGASGTRLQRLCLAGNGFAGERGAGAALGTAGAALVGGRADVPRGASEHHPHRTNKQTNKHVPLLGGLVVCDMRHET